MTKQSEKQAVFLIFTPNTLTTDNVTALINQVKTLIDENMKNITLLISCGGGAVYAGLLAYNFLKGCPANITTHNIGVCDSSAAVIFCSGNRRLSVPHGRFLLHSPSYTFKANTEFQEQGIEEKLAQLRIDVDNIAGVLAQATEKAEEDIHKDMRQSLTLDPQQAKDYGFVHEIIETLYPTGARVIRIA